MSKLPTIVELEYRKLPTRNKRDIETYVKHRVASLKRADKEAKEKGIYRLIGNFLFGRQHEAEKILAMIKHMKKVSK